MATHDVRVRGPSSNGASLSKTWRGSLNTTFDKYELIEKIGAGGMAEVFLAKSVGAEGLEKLLVIKRILPELSSNPRFVEMFIAEARIAVGLNHPNIVQIYDFGKVEADFFLAMEFVDGWDLAGIAEASQCRERISVGDALFIGLEVARGLDYAHRRTDQFGESLGLVHRDISPQNLLVSRDGTIKIVDFGIAQASILENDGPGVVKGKFCYMSPEQARGQVVDHRSDLFSLGVVLFELLCNRTLFKQTTREQTLSLVKSAVVPDISSLNPEIPEALEHVLYKLLARDPGERFQTARELQQALTRVLYSLPEIHDSYTLSEYVGRVGEWLTDEGATGEHGAGATATLSTNIIQTSARTGTTAQRGHTAEMLRTPVTPALDVTTDPGVIEEEERVEIASRSRKEVVVIAGRMSGLIDIRAELGQERWLQVFQEYTRMVDSLAFKSNGVVHRVKENGFVILLGVPISSENDAERGVRVAIDMQDALAGINLSLGAPLQLSIGVAIADVILEQQVSNKGRRYSWSFLGDSQEFAEQLSRTGMAKEILFGSQVWRRVRREYQCEVLEGVEITTSAGSAKPMQAWKLVGPKSVRERLAEVRHAYGVFYGRDVELRGLRESYRRTLMQGQASAMVVLGEQGVGKSTLVEEFLNGLDSRDVRVVRGVANAFDQDVPLGGLGALMSELLRLGPREDLRTVRSTLETRIGALFPEEDDGERAMLLHSIGAIFGIRFPGSSFEELGGGQRRKRISVSLRKLLKRFAEKKPFVISIDDAQYIDAMTLEIATQLFDSRQDAPMFAILSLPSSAMGELEREWQQLLDARYVQGETLDELGDKAAHQMIQDLLRLHRIEDDALVSEIARQSGGNPFYIKEIFEVLRDRGVLSDSGERRKVTLDATGKARTFLPTSVEGVIQARLDRLPFEARAVLQQVALLWSPFAGSHVQQILPDVSLGALDALVQHKLLERVDGPRRARDETWDPAGVAPQERQYRFLNALTQEVVTRTLLDDVASELHGRIADYLLLQQHERNVTDNALLARHLDGAGRVDEAITFYYEAAQAAFRQFGAVESLKLCSKVLERVDDSDEIAFGALHLRAQALREAGLFKEHKEALDKLEEMAVARDEPADIVKIQLRLARYYYDQSDFKQSLRYIELVRPVAERHAILTGLAQASLFEGYIRLDQGRRDDALELVMRALGFYERAEGREAELGLLRCYNTRGVILRRAGLHDEALESYQQAMEHLDGFENEQLGQYLLVNMGLAMVFVGRYTEGLECYKRALGRARMLGHRRDEAGVLINMGHAYQVLGDYKGAKTHIQRGLYLARKTSANYLLADGEISLGVCYAETGEPAKAERVLSEGLRLAESIPHLYLAVHAMLALAELKLESGQPQDARVAIMQAEDSQERCERAGMPWGVMSAHVIQARAYALLGDDAELRRHMNAALEISDGGEEHAREEVLYRYYELMRRWPEHAETSARALRDARAWVEARAAGIEDVALRRAFLERSIHCKILSGT